MANAEHYVETKHCILTNFQFKSCTVINWDHSAVFSSYKAHEAAFCK